MKSSPSEGSSSITEFLVGLSKCLLGGGESLLVLSFAGLPVRARPLLAVPE